jgi:uncharacterized protein YabE (DUF348 family)
LRIFGVVKHKYFAGIVFLCVLALVVIEFGFFQEEPRVLSFNEEKPVVLRDGGMEYQTFTRARTVKEFLKEQDIQLESEEEIYPGLEEEIYPGFQLEIKRKYGIEVKADGKTYQDRMEKMTISQALKKMEIDLSDIDEVSPGRKELIRDGLEVEITRVEEKEITEKFEIEHETVVREDDDLSWGKEKIKQKGKDGLREVDYLVRYENGELVSKEELEKRIVREAIPEIIVQGTKIEVGDIQRGVASWYAHTNDLTCASVRFPRGTWLRVRNQENGKEVIVQVDDYGPSPETGKIIDLEKKAFEKIADPWQGVVEVKVEEILQ